MTIERIMTKDGFPIRFPQTIRDDLLRVAKEYARAIEVLPEGTYDVTPDWFANSNYTYELVVLETGTGVLRLKPRYGNSAMGEARAGKLTAFKKGGKTIRLPEDESVFTVIGPTRDGKTIGIAEIVYWRPGGGNPLLNSHSKK